MTSPYKYKPKIPKQYAKMYKQVKITIKRIELP